MSNKIIDGLNRTPRDQFRTTCGWIAVGFTSMFILLVIAWVAWGS